MAHAALALRAAGWRRTLRLSRCAAFRFTRLGITRAPSDSSEGDCLESQVTAEAGTIADRHLVSCRIIALSVTSSFRMHAVSACFAVLPLPRSRS